MAYTTVKDVVETAGIAGRVDTAEAVGSGNGSTAAWSLLQRPAVNGSLKVWVAGTLKTETTHYTVDYDAGIVTFTAGNIPTAGQAITATYWYFTGGMDSTIVGNFITDADALVDMYSGRTWAEVTVSSETYDGDDQDTLLIRPDHTPITSLTSLAIDGTSVTTSNVYLYPNEGKLILKSTAEVTTFKDTAPQNVAIAYKYGASSTPTIIANFSSHIAAAHLLRAMLGGTFDEACTWTLGSMSVSTEMTSKLSATLANLDADIDDMKRYINRRTVVM